MKTLFTFAATAFAVCVAGNPQYAAAQWPETTSHEPTVTIEFGGIAFDREGDSDSPLTISDTVTNVNTLTNEQGTDLGSAAGAQGKVIFPSRRTHQTFELRGAYAGWDEERTISGDNIGSPFFVPGFLQIEDFIGFDITEEPLSTILPVGVLQQDLNQFTIPLTTAFDGDVSTLGLVWPFLPADIIAQGVSPPTFDNIFDIDSVNTRYESDYVSVELMSRRNTKPGVTWLFGPRFVSVQEEVAVTATGISPTRIFFDPFNPPFTFVFDEDGEQVFEDATTGEIVDEDDDNAIPQIVFTDISGSEQATIATRTSTRNSLIGLQVGLEYNFPVSQDVYFQISGRTGIFANSASVARSVSPLRRTTSLDSNDFVTRDKSSDTGTAYLAELNIRGYVDVIPNQVSCYAGYDLLFVDEIALAPDQLVSPDVIDTSGDLFARGFTFGVKMNY